MGADPWLTVITVTRNNAEALRRTIESVMRQSWPDWECVVVDGGSQDDSVALLHEFVVADSRIRCISETDEGIYDAMNKGLRLATGEVVLFLNAGDVLASPDVLARVRSSWGPAWQFAAGRVRYVSRAGHFEGEYGLSATLTVRDIRLGRAYIPHPAAFIQRTLLCHLGGFNTQFGSAADQLLLIRLVEEHGLPCALPFVVADFELGGLSSSKSEIAISMTWHRIRRELFINVLGSRYVDAAYSLVQGYWRGLRGTLSARRRRRKS